MFVVSTVPQLEEAIRERVREVMVIGKLAPKLLEIVNQPSSGGEHDNAANYDFILNRLVDHFKICAIQDNAEKVLAVICQSPQPNSESDHGFF